MKKFEPFTSAVLYRQDMALIYSALGKSKKATAARRLLAERSHSNYTDEAKARLTKYQKQAQKQGEDGVVEVDEYAQVSEGGDTGTYVQAWIWVSDADL